MEKTASEPRLCKTWVSSRDMAADLGIGYGTLLKFRTHLYSPFAEGTHYRWVGLSASGTLQWNHVATQAAFSAYKRMPIESVETYSKAPLVMSRG